MGDVATNKLSDAEYAAKSYLLALSERRATAPSSPS